MSREPALVAALQAAGLRVTGPRLAVLRLLRAGRVHYPAEHIVAQVRAQTDTNVSMQTVYNVLHSLERAGLVRSVELAGSPALFEARLPDAHHHLVCRQCGTVRDVPCANGAQPCLSTPDGFGFAIEEAEVTFWGVCPDCQAAGRGGAEHA